MEDSNCCSTWDGHNNHQYPTRESPMPPAGFFKMNGTADVYMRKIYDHVLGLRVRTVHSTWGFSNDSAGIERGRLRRQHHLGDVFHRAVAQATSSL